MSNLRQTTVIGRLCGEVAATANRGHSPVGRHMAGSGGFGILVARKRGIRVRAWIGGILGAANER